MRSRAIPLTVLLVVPSVVTGCYASSVLDEGSSGSRLRARHWVPESGERSFAGWFDSELGRDCAFVWLEGGGYRCVPLSDARPGPTHYADAACTEPVVAVETDSRCGAVDRDFMYSLVQRDERTECTDGGQLRFYELDSRGSTRPQPTIGRRLGSHARSAFAIAASTSFSWYGLASFPLFHEMMTLTPDWWPHFRWEPLPSSRRKPALRW